jgi:hypothetical protein
MQRSTIHYVNKNGKTGKCILLLIDIDRIEAMLREKIFSNRKARRASPNDRYPFDIEKAGWPQKRPHRMW